MEKEVTPIPAKINPTQPQKNIKKKELPEQKQIQKNIQPAPVPKKNNTKIGYKPIGTKNETNWLKEIIPKDLIPNKHFGTAFAIIFLLSLLMIFFQFPLGKILSGVIDIEIGIGFPFLFTFLKISTMEARMDYANLSLNILTYTILSYIINVLINYIKKTLFTGKRKILNQAPILYKQKPKTKIDNVIKTIFKKQPSKIS